MKKILIIPLILIILFIGCEQGFRFLVCPYESSLKMKTEKSFFLQREILFKLDYVVLIVSNDKQGKIEPVMHYYAVAPFANKIRPESVSWAHPQRIGNIMIIDKPNHPIGIAIKKINDEIWRLYWVDKNAMKELKKTGIAYLPPYETLPEIPKEVIE